MALVRDALGFEAGNFPERPELLERMAALPWDDVDSTNVEAVAWCRSTEFEGIPLGWLWMRFKSGYVYCYEEVPEGLWLAVINADSVGSCFNRLVKGKYPAAALSPTGQSLVQR